MGLQTFGVGMLMWPIALLSAVFWMFVAWRAMRAHERLADAAQELARHGRGVP